MEQIKADEATQAVQIPKRAQDIQEFCHKEFSGMPTKIMRNDEGKIFILGASKTFIIFLDTEHGDAISLSLLGDVAQSAHIYHMLVSKFNLTQIAPCCEDASDGLIKYGDQAYVALMKHRMLEARHNIEQAAKQQGVLAEENEAGIVGANGEAISKDGPKIITG